MSAISFFMAISVLSLSAVSGQGAETHPGVLVPVKPDEVIVRGYVGGRVGRNLSEAEWEESLSFLPYTELCQDVGAESWTESEQLDAPRPTSPLEHRTPDGLPTIYYFEAVPGCSVRSGESVTLRWHLAGATEVYLEYGDKRHGVTAPNEQVFTPRGDTTFRLIAVNTVGGRELIRTLTLTILVNAE